MSFKINKKVKKQQQKNTKQFILNSKFDRDVT